MSDVEGRPPDETLGSEAGDVSAGEVTIRQGGARSVAAKAVTIRQGGAGRIEAQEVRVTQGGVVAAAGLVVSKTVHARDSAIGLVLAREFHGERVRVLVGPRGALAFGAGLALAFAVVAAPRRRS